MKVLEVRYHPTGDPRKFTVVGRIVCYEQHAEIELEPQAATSPPSMVSNLKYLAAMSAPRPFETLRSVDSRFWSFVEDDDHEGSAAND